MKNRKGSTLVITLLVFLVLMIFGTFILSFMVTENKQSLHHQYKTEAHYLARSGAVAVEAAIMEVYDIDNGISLNDNITEIEKSVTVDGIDAVVTVKKEKDGEEIAGNQKYIYTIKSEGKSNNIKDIVEKVILVNVIKTTEAVVKITSPLTYINNISDVLKKEPFKAQKGNKEDYPEYSFEFENFSKTTSFTKLTSVGSTLNAGNYTVDGDLTLSGKTVEIRGGEVNIHVKKLVSLNNTNIKYKDDSCKLNIYIYGEGSAANEYTLKLGIDNGESTPMQANFFVKKGNTKFDYHKVDFIGNIVSNGNVIDLVSHDNGNADHVEIKGIIYGPNATINFGKINEDWAAISITGAVVGNEIWYKSKNDKDNQIKKFKVSGTLDGIDSPFKDKVTITVTKNPGYFK